VIDVPPVVRDKARVAGAGAWLRDLPVLLADLERRWRIAIGRPYDGGTEAYVAEATRADGTPAVVKLMIPRPGDHARHEIAVLRLAGGDGCVELFEADETRGAMLLERLGPSLFDLAVPYERRLEILCDAARRVWRPATGLPTGAEKGRWLIEHIRRQFADLGRPCAQRTVDQAIGAAERRIAAHDDATAVLVHGDVHQWNALRSGDAGVPLERSTGTPRFKLVDPDGLLAEPEYDLGMLMREDPVELMAADPWDRARLLAARTGTDPVAVWEWGLVERVSTGLLAVGIGLQPVGDQMLAAADEISRRAGSAR
jgi:streptomycin 6-kinase